MAFCENCGRPLADGEICNCTQKADGGNVNQKNWIRTVKIMQRKFVTCSSAFAG